MESNLVLQKCLKPTLGTVHNDGCDDGFNWTTGLGRYYTLVYYMYNQPRHTRYMQVVVVGKR